jgi:signal transduction histidine kinase
MTAAHEILAARTDEVFLRWRDMVHGTLLPESIPAVELIDHLPVFLAEVIAALRDDISPSEASRGAGRTAAAHGSQRLRLGFSLDSVVHEYGALRDAIVDTVREAGAQMTFRELQVIFDATIGGIAYAVSEYTRQRNAELHRQHNEHIAFIAHELRGPLSSAMMAFTILQRAGHIPADNRAAQALARGHQLMREGIDHSLNLARTASGVDLRLERVSLADVLQEAELAAAGEAQEKQVTLRIASVEQVIIDIDLRLFRSALDNIVRNAVKYTTRGSSVELRAHIVAGHICIEVEDCCGGLPPGKVEEAFAPFVRLDSGEPGFGLGLAIAKHAVDAHGGTIRVQNLPGKGCIFILELPITSPAG